MPKIVNERDVEKPCVAYARKLGVLVVKQTHAGARSFPDRAFYFMGGRLLQIEFKAPGKLPTTQQAHTIQDLRIRGYDVQVIDNKEDGIRLIDNRYNGDLVGIDTSFDGFTTQAVQKGLKR